jgi:hypothetical protein
MAITKKRSHARRATWSASVTKHSDALDIVTRTFARRSPRAIAQALKRSALRSRRRKAGPFQSAMSMLNFYINRGGRGLPPARRKVLEQAKDELRKAFHRA